MPKTPKRPMSDPADGESGDREKQAGAAHALLKAVRQGAEILADHHAAVAVALERDDPDQVVEGIRDIGALGRRTALGNPEQPHQPQHVVDAESAGTAHVRAEKLGERGSALIAETVDEVPDDDDDLNADQQE